MSKLTTYEKEDFLEIAKNPELVSALVDISENNSINYTLEGFIYPDTYVIPVENSPEEILKIMIDEFRKKWENILKDQTRFSLYEYLTIASLIEKEARLDEEKPIISGVIYNRINKDMALQIDASVQYILDEWKKRLLYKDLEEDSPYNTYLFKGLPPGPICNPGDESIEAALEPAKVEYLFYFALDNGSHIFTKTYKEHLNKQKELKQED